MRIGADVPGTPSMRALPSYVMAPSGVCSSTSDSIPVLRVSIRTVVSALRTGMSPARAPNGPTAASMLPQLGVVSTRDSLISTCANRKSRSTPGCVERDTSPTLLVSGSAPPEAIDLAPVGRAHRRQQHPVAQRGIRGKVGFEEEGAARRAAAHEEARDGGLHGAFLGELDTLCPHPLTSQSRIAILAAMPIRHGRRRSYSERSTPHRRAGNEGEARTWI